MCNLCGDKRINMFRIYEGQANLFAMIFVCCQCFHLSGIHLVICAGLAGINGVVFYNYFLEAMARMSEE